MQVIGIILLILSGISVLHLISPRFNTLEKIGLGYILGMAINAFWMLVFDLISVKINLGSTFLALIVSALPGLIIGKKEVFTSFQINKFVILKYVQNFTWLACIFIAIYLIYAIGLKSGYWPTLEYDSVTGYDLMGKAIAHEGKINNSLFQPSFNTREFVRLLYPPFASGNFAYAYLIGFDAPNVMIVLHFVAFLLVFYSFISKISGHMAAAFFTLLCMVTPEFFSHAAMALTNLPNGIHTGLMMISLFLFFQSKEKRYAVVSMCLGFANTLTRTDALIFSLVGVGFMLIYSVLKKDWLVTICYAVVSVLPFLIWNQYLANVLHAESSAGYFVKHLFFDADKIAQIGTYLHQYMIADAGFYGISFFLFFIMLVANLIWWKQETNLFLLIALAAWFGYTFLYYQMDNTVIDSLDVLMKASYKRGLFNFIPLLWFYIACSKLSTLAFGRIEKLLYGEDKN